MAPDSNPMKAAMEKASAAPTPVAKSCSGTKPSAVMPSGAAPRDMASKMITTMNSRATTMPRTFAERSTRVMPISPTATQAMRAQTHQDSAMPNIPSRKEEKTKPNIPAIPICMAL